MLSKIGGFCSGTVLAAGFALYMDDLIYSQMRKHILHPLTVLTMKDMSKDPITFSELRSVGEGTSTFLSQFKPHALLNPNLRKLLLDDSEFSTP